MPVQPHNFDAINESLALCLPQLRARTKEEVKRYIVVFVALGCLTIVTVGLSYLKVSMTIAIILALIVATIKASLVACYFMHLISEKKVIYMVLCFTMLFFAGTTPKNTMIVPCIAPSVL